MSRNDRKPKADRTCEPDPYLQSHIRSLGLSAVDEYVAWCLRHGFGRRTDKDWRQRQKEVDYAFRTAAADRLARHKRESRKPEKVLEQIFSGELREEDVTQRHLVAVCRACKSAQENRHTRQGFFDLLRHVSGRCDLLSDHPVSERYGSTYVDGLVALARHSRNWVRPPADWKPQTHNCRRQFASLARHLFAEWPVPAFMDSVWFLGNNREAVRRQGWFLHVGRGQNIRTADLPIPLTKRMAHHFLEAPDDFSVDAALRWGQVHGLGGTERLARAVVGSRLGYFFANDDFWVTVLRFFVANPMLDLAQVGPIVDYLHARRFAPDLVAREGPPQPELTMKGRTPASLLRQVEAWHRGLYKIYQPKAQWPPSGIDAFEFVEGTEGGSQKVWTITELLSTKALLTEGRWMKHCVVTYARSCAGGTCSIWTLQVHTCEGPSRALTVEVRNRDRVICQARGKYNELPGDKQRGILRRWAERAGLSLAKYV
jgi:hypothetical protein